MVVPSTAAPPAAVNARVIEAAPTMDATSATATDTAVSLTTNATVELALNVMLASNATAHFVSTATQITKTTEEVHATVTTQLISNGTVAVPA
jgi:hypothetical protein